MTRLNVDKVVRKSTRTALIVFTTPVFVVILLIWGIFRITAALIAGGLIAGLLGGVGYWIAKFSIYLHGHFLIHNPGTSLRSWIWIICGNIALLFPLLIGVVIGTIGSLTMFGATAVCVWGKMRPTYLYQLRKSLWSSLRGAVRQSQR